MVKNNSSLRYAAGACFAILAIMEIIFCVQNVQNEYPFNAWSILFIAGYVLIAAAMFSAVPVLTAVGGGVLSIVSARGLIIYLRQLEYVPKRYLIIQILFLAVWILIIVAALNVKRGKTLGMAAGALCVLRFFIVIFGIKLDIGVFGLDFLDFFYWLAYIVGVFMIGLAFDGISTKHSELANGKANGSMNIAPAESQIERLSKLKVFLDNGVISQEEFDAKKKQISGQ